ncbi:MAG: nucleotidyl transferase AbiEii/AbiGii toxin family protein [Fibrobacteres bacterium]|nr:nucleotidyl transferase AbiEii/AbiGii toxin family protein [Fibrobacterota bacterium]
MSKPLGKPECFTAAHIEKNRKEAPAALAEQAIRSLELVAELTAEGLDFTFKGGNSLLLILDKPRRFSIDVDIATAESKERVDQVVHACQEKYGVFTRIEHRPHKTKPWLPMTSYNLYYESAMGTGETFIMLDAMFQPSLYRLQKKKAVCGVLFESSTEVKLPEPASILADKLLTLGPKTLGIPYGKNKEGQRLKHVHDAALLVSLKPDLALVREALNKCHAQELELQERPLPIYDVLTDTLKFLALSTVSDTEPVPAEDADIGLKEMVKGRAPFEGHLFVKEYDWKRLRKDAALCAAAITAAVVESVSVSDFEAMTTETDPLVVWKKISTIVDI